MRYINTVNMRYFGVYIATEWVFTGKGYLVSSWFCVIEFLSQLVKLFGGLRTHLNRLLFIGLEHLNSCVNITIYWNLCKMLAIILWHKRKCIHRWKVRHSCKDTLRYVYAYAAIINCFSYGRSVRLCKLYFEFFDFLQQIRHVSLARSFLDSSL